MASGSGSLRLMAVGGILAAALAGGTAAGSAPESAEPGDGGVVELTLGDWSGVGVASGVSTAIKEGASLTWEAGFEARFRMTVTEATTTGTFTLTSSGLGPDPMMKMLLTGLTDATFEASWNISPPASGTIDGDRSLLVFNAGTVTTAGFVNVPGVGRQEISGNPSQVSIDNTIEHLECDSATGNWDISVIQQIESEGWTATWNGAWVAFPVPDPLQQTEAEELIDGLEELFSDFDAFSLTASNAIDPDATYDPTSIDRGQLTSLARRATEMSNRIHNLSPCDAEAIGAETLQEWSTALARGVGDLVLAAADIVADLDELVHLEFVTLNGLLAAADATGAYGAGSTLGPVEAFQVEDALAFLTGQSVERHLDFANGRQTDCRDLACRTDHYLWAAGGVAAAVSRGWTISVNDQAYAPADAPSLLADPPNESA